MHRTLRGSNRKGGGLVKPQDISLMFNQDSPISESEQGTPPKLSAELRNISSHEKDAGQNDATDLLTPLSCWTSNQTFPDKERSPSGTLSGSSLGLFESSGRTSQRSRSFKSSSRNNSFTSLKGPTPSLQTLSRQVSECSPANSDSSRQRGRAPLKVFVRTPSSSNGDSPHPPISMDSLEFLSKVAEKAAQDAREGLGDEENQRPPSPRPHDENSSMYLHSEVLEEWEDVARFRQHEQISLAGPKYKRSDSRSAKHRASGQ